MNNDNPNPADFQYGSDPVGFINLSGIVCVSVGRDGSNVRDELDDVSVRFLNNTNSITLRMSRKDYNRLVRDLTMYWSGR